MAGVVYGGALRPEMSAQFEEMAPPLCDGSQPPSSRTGPRFYVTSLTGYSGEGGNDSHEATVYQVIDSALGFALVSQRYTRRAAEGDAARLNRPDEQERELRARPQVAIPAGSRLKHGSYSCYVNLRCRCFDCTTAMRGRWKKWAKS